MAPKKKKKKDEENEENVVLLENSEMKTLENTEIGPLENTEIKTTTEIPENNGMNINIKVSDSETRSFKPTDLLIDYFYHNYLKSVLKYRPSTLVGLLSAIYLVFNFETYKEYLKNLSFTKKVILSAIFCAFLNELARGMGMPLLTKLIPFFKRAKRALS